jgi:hypothetical protein
MTLGDGGSETKVETIARGRAGTTGAVPRATSQLHLLIPLTPDSVATAIDFRQARFFYPILAE